MEVGQMKSAIRMENIVKRFPGVLANDQVSLEVAEGEIHGLVGENGAGKSTLMNILYGMFEPDAGQIFIRDIPVKIRNPMDAIRHGIGMVHQHFMLVPSLTVLENVVLGLTPTRFGMTNLRRARDMVKAIEEKFSLNVELDARVYQFSVGEMQRTEILKALYRGAQFLILDEPTAVLVPQEIEHLFHVLRELVSKDHAIIFITHKLKEVLSVTDYVTVLRRGKITGQLTTSETNEQQLANMMVGRDVVLQVEKPPALVKNDVLHVSGVSALSSRNLPALEPHLLIAAQPGRGVDIGALEYIQQHLIELCDRSRAILLLSSELEDILALADRILVMYEGEIVAACQKLGKKKFGGR
jgi:simple sugar transport system ATP-binding protein